MDNRTIDVTTEDLSEIEYVLKLIWKNAPGGKASHFKITKIKEIVRYIGNPVDDHYTENEEADDGVDTLILYWNSDSGNHPLPYPLELDEAVSFIQGWLKKLKYPEAPDTDGSCHKGFRAFTDPHWGMVAGSHYGIIGIQPAFAMYGK